MPHDGATAADLVGGEVIGTPAPNDFSVFPVDALQLVVEVGEELEPPATAGETARVVTGIETEGPSRMIMNLATSNMSYDNDPRLTNSRVSKQIRAFAAVGFAIIRIDEEING